MFKGLFTAIITPFTEDQNIDFQSLDSLIEDQINGKVDGIVVMGTTGESPTLSTEEHNEVISYVVERVDKRILVIAGTGSNCTREAIAHSLHAQNAGADGLLLVNPYYNKPTQEGLYQHFWAIANEVNIPIMLYNIEGRTGVNLETQTLLRLSSHPNIVSVKEASGNLDQIKEVINLVPKGFTVLSGDDGITVDLMKLGGHGSVSVLSNVLPQEMKVLVDLCKKKDWDAASKQNKDLAPLFEACFIETNPQPIKTLLSHQGRCEEVFRLPLIKMEESNKKNMIKTWEDFSSKE